MLKGYWINILHPIQSIGHTTQVKEFGIGRTGIARRASLLGCVCGRKQLAKNVVRFAIVAMRDFEQPL